MGELDRASAAEVFQESLQQLQSHLQSAEGKAPKIPPKVNREQQLAAMADAIADLEAFLNHQTPPPTTENLTPHYFGTVELPITPGSRPEMDLGENRSRNL